MAQNKGLEGFPLAFAGKRSKLYLEERGDEIGFLPLFNLESFGESLRFKGHHHTYILLQNYCGVSPSVGSLAMIFTKRILGNRQEFTWKAIGKILMRLV